ncbi:MAG: CGNR zinc finger domain-containing protein [Micromonosporaceae bacterium]
MEAGKLELVRGFVNTRDYESDSEALSTPHDLSEWLSQHGLLNSDVMASQGDLTRAIELREAIRELLAANHDRTTDSAANTELEGASQVLTAAAARARLAVEFVPSGGFRFAPEATGVNRAVGELPVVAAEAMVDGTWRRLKVCRNDLCQWAFFDRSRSGAGKWCSMAICGNRQKARAWRARQRKE